MASKSLLTNSTYPGTGKYFLWVEGWGGKKGEGYTRGGGGTK